MKKPLARIISRLANEPWLITPSKHATLMDVAMRNSPVAFWEPDEPADGEQEPERPKYINIDGVAVISVSGVLGMRLDVFSRWCGGCDCLDVREAVTLAVNDPLVRAIVLHVDSPGGTVTGIAETAEHVRKATGSKPILAFADSEMCSAAYWIASAADQIYCTPTASVGSIGAYLALLDSSKAYEMIGYKREVLADGKFKGAGIDGTSLTAEQRANLQAGVDAISGLFKSFVKAQRPGVSDETMQGQCLWGWECVDAGLVDVVVQSVEECVADARAAGGVVAGTVATAVGAKQ